MDRPESTSLMLRGAIICPDRELGDRLVSALLESHRIGVVRRLEAYPNAVDLGRFLRAAAPEIVFLSIETRQLALAKMPDTNVMLADLDLNSGLVGFMLLLNQSPYSIVDAAENALDLDENLWPKIVSTKDHLDVLPVGKLSPGFRIEATQIRHI